MSHLLLSSFVVHACLRYSSRLFLNNLFFVPSACDASRDAHLTFDRYSLAHVEQVRAANQALAVQQPIHFTMVRFVQHSVKEQVDVVVYLVSLCTTGLIFGLSNPFQ